jgi:hypothetical protein
LVNAGKEGHDFTAPDFFRSAILQDTGFFNESKTSVFPAAAADDRHLSCCPQRRIVCSRCADHDWAGMTATILIE